MYFKYNDGSWKWVQYKTDVCLLYTERAITVGADLFAYGEVRPTIVE